MTSSPFADLENGFLNPAMGQVFGEDVVFVPKLQSAYLAGGVDASRAQVSGKAVVLASSGVRAPSGSAGC
jgi:hypothetical protein